MSRTLTWIDAASLAPLLILLIGALLILVWESFANHLSKKIPLFLALLSIFAAFCVALYAPISENLLLTTWIKQDSFSRVFTLLFLAIGFASALLADAFFQRFSVTTGEYFFFLLTSLFGLLLVAGSADFLTLFLGIETLSIPLYVLCGYMKKWESSHESAMKYFLIGSLAAAFLLYGIALIYGATGTTQFAGLLDAYHSAEIPQGRALFLGGIALVTLGLAFKAAVVPFHFWAPDVYSGASNPVTAFMAVGTKVGAFAAFARLFFLVLPQFDPIWNQAMAILVYPTLIYANLVAIRQTQLRRFFAYSGISHAGFLLILFATGGAEALPAMTFYLVVYALATLGCFAVLALLDRKQSGALMHDLSGLFRQAPLSALLLAFCLLTLAGIPPTAGFFAKFYLFKVAYQAGYVSLVVIGLLTSILSAFYYLRIIGILFAEVPDSHQEPVTSISSAMAVGIFSSVAILVLSCYPMLLLQLL